MSHVTFSFKRDERDLLLSALTGLDPAVRRKLTLCEWRDKRLVVELEREKTIDLILSIDSVSPQLTRPSRRKLRLIRDRIISRMYLYDDQPPVPRPSDPPVVFPPSEGGEGPEAMYRFINQQMQNLDDPDEEKLNRIVELASYHYNTSPQKALGGLSPAQMQKLLYSDYCSDDSAILLNTDLAFDDLKESEILVNARHFLHLLNETDGTRATTAGNLNRIFVQQMVERMVLPPNMVVDSFPKSEKRNERDVFRLHILRLLLEMGKMIRRVKGRFVLTRSGKHNLHDSHAGLLYHTLFTSFLLKLNHEYLFPFVMFHDTQRNFAYSLYRLHTRAGEWIRREEFVDLLILVPWSGDPMPDDLHDREGRSQSEIMVKLLKPLQHFGLIELQEAPSEAFPQLMQVEAIRTTALFDKFFRFKL